MATYAAQTTVTSDQSRAEIERTLTRYGASSFLYGWDANAAVIGFVMQGRQIRFRLELPPRDGDDFTKHSRGRRTPEAAEKLWEQAVRQRWRALALVVKAKLEAVESGITSFEDEFLAHTVLPDGRSFGDWARPQMAIAFSSGAMPELLPAYGGGGK